MKNKTKFSGVLQHGHREYQPQGKKGTPDATSTAKAGVRKKNPYSRGKRYKEEGTQWLRALGADLYWLSTRCFQIRAVARPPWACTIHAAFSLLLYDICMPVILDYVAGRRSCRTGLKRLHAFQRGAQVYLQPWAYPAPVGFFKCPKLRD